MEVIFYRILHEIPPDGNKRFGLSRVSMDDPSGSASPGTPGCWAANTDLERIQFQQV